MGTDSILSISSFSSCLAPESFRACPKHLPALGASTAPDLWLFSPYPLQIRAQEIKLQPSARLPLLKHDPSFSKTAPRESQTTFSHQQERGVLSFSVHLEISYRKSAAKNSPLSKSSRSEQCQLGESYIKKNEINFASEFMQAVDCCFFSFLRPRGLIYLQSIGFQTKPQGVFHGCSHLVTLLLFLLLCMFIWLNWSLNTSVKLFMGREFCFRYHAYLHQKLDARNYTHSSKEQKHTHKDDCIQGKQHQNQAQRMNWQQLWNLLTSTVQFPLVHCSSPTSCPAAMLHSSFHFPQLHPSLKPGPACPSLCVCACYSPRDHRSHWWEARSWFRFLGLTLCCWVKAV